MLGTTGSMTYVQFEELDLARCNATRKSASRFAFAIGPSGKEIWSSAPDAVRILSTPTYHRTVS